MTTGSANGAKLEEECISEEIQSVSYWLNHAGDKVLIRKFFNIPGAAKFLKFESFTNLKILREAQSLYIRNQLQPHSYVSDPNWPYCTRWLSSISF